MPVRIISPKHPPTLLLHANDDVPYERPALMVDALGESGVTHELVTIPDAGHPFDNDTTEADVSVDGPASRGYPLLKTARFLETAFT